MKNVTEKDCRQCGERAKYCDHCYKGEVKWKVKERAKEVKMFRKVIVFKSVRYRGNSFEKVEDYRGLFHQWGTESEEFSDGAVECTVAIVEKEDGSICTVMPTNVKFIQD